MGSSPEIGIINKPLLLHLVGVYIIYIYGARSNKYRTLELVYILLYMGKVNRQHIYIWDFFTLDISEARCKYMERLGKILGFLYLKKKKKEKEKINVSEQMNNLSTAPS